MSTQHDGLHHGRVKGTRVRVYLEGGVVVPAELTGLGRHGAALAIHGPAVPLQLSAVLERLEILFQDEVLYDGRAVVNSLVNTGAAQCCEVSLTGEGWTGQGLAGDALSRLDLSDRFRQFLGEWQKLYHVRDDFKVVVADIQTFLTDLNLWLQRVELDLDRLGDEEKEGREAAFVREARDAAVPALERLFSRFEGVCQGIPSALLPAHRAFCQRQLHPLMLCAPFIHRTYSKPLGFAGDYEMMNMIMRNGMEGGSLFAKVVNAYMLNQAPAHGVRSRVELLRSRLKAETLRVSRAGEVAQVFSVACGPAHEVQLFIEESRLADEAAFRLLDFHSETLAHTRARLEEAKQRCHRRTRLEWVQDSVQGLIRRRGRGGESEAAYDLIYCSGLYDYLSDNMCRALNTHLYGRLRPGGLLLVGNFAPHNPIRHIMEHVLEWYLIYRDRGRLLAAAPAQVESGECRVVVEDSGTNLFLEVRKPE